jgi:hypothetical protein
MNNVSANYLAAAIASNQIIAVKFEVWTGPSATMAPSRIRDITQYVTRASWGEDETASPRSTCTVTLESQGLGLDNLVPQVSGDLLHPLSKNELRIFAGFTYTVNGLPTTEYAPQGVFRMSKPKIVDDQSKVEITITGNDRASEIERRKWTAPYVISGAPTIDQAVHSLLASKMAGLTYSLEPTTFTVPDTTLGTQGSASGAGPMSDAIKLCKAAGQEVFFDAQGVVVSRTIPDPTTAVVNLTFIEGATCTMSSLQRILDETQTYNGVVVTSSTPGTAFPVTATVWVTDPASPLNPLTYGYVPYFYSSPLVTTYAQAVAAATSLLQTLLTAFDDTSFTASPNPALRAGDCLQLTRARVGVSNTYAASQISFTYDSGPTAPVQPMSVTNRARRSA